MKGFGSFEDITPSKNPQKLAGTDGVVVLGGKIYDGERNPRLSGSNKWLTYDNNLQGILPIVAACRAFNTFLRSANWTAEPNPLGGAQAEKMADIATEGLLDAPLAKPWSAVVGKTGTGAAFKGHSLHEWSGSKRKTPGAPWWFTNIEERPQHTIDQWLKPDEREPWIGVVQRTSLGGVYPIARSKLFHVSDDAISNSPEGTGYLRHLFEAADAYKRLHQLERHGFETNLAGMPLVRVPLTKLMNEARTLYGDDVTKITAYIEAQCEFVDKFIEGHIASPSRGLRLDSQPYLSLDDKATPSAIYQWALEVVKHTGMNFAELRTALKDLGKEILRVIGFEWLAMGDSEGARSVHDGKTAISALSVNSWLKQIGYYATAQLAYPMTALNGFDPETCTPRLRPSPIPLESVQEVCDSLEALTKAGAPLPPDWEGWNVVLAREELPPIDLEKAAEEAMLPRGEPEPGAKSTKKPSDDDEVPEPALERGEE